MSITYIFRRLILVFTENICTKILVGRMRSNLLWSLHMRHTYLLVVLYIRKNTAVFSVRSFEAKANKPNGPIMLLLDANSSLPSSWGSTSLGSNNSALSSSGSSNNTSTSALKVQKLKIITIYIVIAQKIRR